jgi:hypothetical protein
MARIRLGSRIDIYIPKSEVWAAIGWRGIV